MALPSYMLSFGHMCIDSHPGTISLIPKLSQWRVLVSRDVTCVLMEAIFSICGYYNYLNSDEFQLHKNNNITRCRVTEQLKQRRKVGMTA